MKRTRKYIFIIMVLLLVGFLVSCGEKVQAGSVVVTSSAKADRLVYYEKYIDQGSPEFDSSKRPTQDVGPNNFLFYALSSTGAILGTDGKLGNAFGYDSSSMTRELISEGTELSPGIKTWEYSFNNIKDSNDNRLKAQMSYYIVPIGETSEEPVMMAIRAKASSGIIYNQGQSYKLRDIDVYVVKANGDIDVYTQNPDTSIGEKDITLLTLNQYDGDTKLTGSMGEITDDGFRVNKKITTEFQLGELKASYNVYISEGERPIHKKDAKWFDYVLVIPIAWIMQLVSFDFFALGIFLTTIIVRTLAWPIYAKTNDMSFRMQLAQPEMQKVQSKYANRTDPQAKQQMQIELQKVYKKYKVNMFGCLMPLLQMPIFMAMYNVVRRITLEGGMYADKVSNHGFLGIDLSGAQNWANWVFAGLVGVTMVALQWYSQRKPKDQKKTYTHNQKDPKADQTAKTMKFVSYFMVIMMVIASFSSKALAFYWIVGNLYSLGQSAINKYLNARKTKKIQDSTNIIDI